MSTDTQRKLLIVEDNPMYLENVYQALSGAGHNVKTAANSREACRLLAGENFEYLIIDLYLGDDNRTGTDLAIHLKKLDPGIKIIEMTNSVKYMRGYPSGADERIEKPEYKLWPKVFSDLLKQLEMTPADKKMRFELLKNFRGVDTIQYISRSITPQNVEGLNCISNFDQESLRGVAYRLPEHDANQINIGLPATIGCNGACRFCLTGRKRRFIRELTKAEMVNMAYIGLHSIQAHDFFLPGKKIVFNLTCEGDSIFYNFRNSIEAVEDLYHLCHFDTSFIMTSIGRERYLKEFLKHYSHLPVRFYWSVNTLDPKLRAVLMPVASKQSLSRLRELYREIAEKTEKKVTFSYIVFCGINDSSRDADRIADFIGGMDEFEVKLMGVDNYFSNDFGYTTNKDVDKFAQKLRSRGLKQCRVRKVIGGPYFSGCGTTIPKNEIEL